MGAVLSRRPEPICTLRTRPINCAESCSRSRELIRNEGATEIDTQPVLTSGNLWKIIWSQFWPMLIIMVFSFLVGLADVYVAGLIGPAVQAAVGFVTQIYFLIIIVANAISIGTLALVSRAIGAGDTGSAVDTAKQSLIFSMGAGVLLTVIPLMGSREIVAAAGFPPETREIAENFLRIFSFALGPNYILINTNAVFRARGEVKKPLLTMTVVSVTNIALDFLLVFGAGPIPAWGYPGIASATAAASAAGMALNLLLLFRSRFWRSIYSEPRAVSPRTIRAIFRIGWPAAFLQIAWNTASIMLYNILARLKEAGIVSLASIANGLRIEAIIFLPAFALNMAASVLVGQNLGAGRPDQAENIGWRLAVMGAALTGAMAIIIFLWADRLASFLTGDDAVLQETARYLRINMFSEPFMALGTVMSGCLQGAGDTRSTMWVIFVSMWLVRLPLAWIFSHELSYGAPGVWTAMTISMCFQGLMMAWRFKLGRWKRLKISEE
ncbi:MAG: MATE family efflux transporter [Syntrophales bacterium]|nr:MATE family efflux transporter [Syntrophales bacterium]